MMNRDLWTFRQLPLDVDLTGFGIEATDGSIGKVDEATYDTGQSWLVVDTGPWIFGKKVLLPAGIVRQIDVDERVVFVDRLKDEIKNAPEFDETRYRELPYMEQIGTYYERGERREAV